MDYDLLIPIALFAAVAATAVSFFQSRQRTNGQIQQTIREALAKNQELTPELLEGIRGQPPSGGADLRRGIISTGVGISIVAFALILGEQDAVRPLSALSAFPFLLGLAYFGLWYFKGR